MGIGYLCGRSKITEKLMNEMLVERRIVDEQALSETEV